MHANKELFAKVYGTVMKEIHKYYVDKAIALGIKNPKVGTASSISGQSRNSGPSFSQLLTATFKAESSNC